MWYLVAFHTIVFHRNRLSHHGWVNIHPQAKSAEKPRKRRISGIPFFGAEMARRAAVRTARHTHFHFRFGLYGIVEKCYSGIADVRNLDFLEFAEVVDFANTVRRTDFE